MGCNNAKQRVNYSDSEYVEEVEIRQFEEEIGAFKKSLGNVLPRICIEKDVIPVANVENYILKDFSENFVQLIRQGYFYKEVNGVKFYDARKISLLLFLLTNDTIVNNGKLKYHDKASFLFTSVKTRDDQNLCESLEDYEENFLKFMNDLVDIAFSGIIDSFIRIKNVKGDGMLHKFKAIQTEVVSQIIKDMFLVKDAQRSGGLTFEEVNTKFEKDKWFLTAGFIRDAAWNILANGKGNEIETKEREKAATDAKNKK